MKKNENKQIQNQQEWKEIDTTVDKEQYDFSNLKMDLNDVLSLEQVTVSETLIQATLLRAKEAQRVEGLDEITATKEENIREQERHEGQEANTVEQRIYDKKYPKNKKYHRIQYGLLAASACILAIAGYSMIDSLGSKKDTATEISKNNTSVNAESASEETTAADMNEDAMMDSNEEAAVDNSMLTEGSDKSESVIIDEDNGDGSDNTATSSGEIEDVGELFTIEQKENTYQITEDQIAQIIIYDEKGMALQTISDTNTIQIMYKIFQENTYTDVTKLENGAYTGQYVRQYAIIANNDANWSAFTIWITKNEKDTDIFTVRSQLLTEDELLVTRKMKGLTEVNMRNLLSCEEQE
ncbi:hypothetical protein [Anaerosporobacter faecicola]|uniref:hypothetical protein n=1 Tax=Anaerosporobacter faecicola TaxID=2718714 RepID=UPI001439A021|nr:hypothetical protein [Anaerosporobacter faecicola]